MVKITQSSQMISCINPEESNISFTGYQLVINLEMSIFKLCSWSANVQAENKLSFHADSHINIFRYTYCLCTICYVQNVQTILSPAMSFSCSIMVTGSVTTQTKQQRYLSNSMTFHHRWCKNSLYLICINFLRLKL